MPKRYLSSFSVVFAAAALGLSLAVGSARAQPGDTPRGSESVFELIAPLANDRALGYFITDAMLPDGTPGGDAELCAWALDDWVRNSQGRLAVMPAAESDALIRVYFVSPGAGRYGEMRPIRVGDRRGAEVYVRAETDTLGDEIATAAADDPLLRETIVYLTCLHEIGHALGMVHTAEFADVMYFFGLGGDIPFFFDRYRSRLEERQDIASESGLSAGDIAQLLAAYPED